MRGMQHLAPADATPRDLGFAMPAEWEKHAATWMSWPADDDLWFGHLDGVRAEFAELVATIARFEPVHLLVRDEESDTDARARLGNANVKYHRVPLDDVWMRDNGPIFVQRHLDGRTEVSLVNWKFNAWGGKFHFANDDRVPEYVAGTMNAAHWDMNIVLEGGGLEVNGAGVGLTTRSCFLTDTRNPGLTEEGYTLLLHDLLGVKKLLWLDGGLENDHTDGHIDTITRFTDPRTIVTSVEPDPADPNDARALEVLRPLFPDREVIGLPSRQIIEGGGSFHCVTQQQPAGVVWKGE